MKKNIILSLFLLGSYLTMAQAQLDDYKYIIVPKKFNDFKKENQYLTSTLIKHLFVEKGFNAVYEGDLPEDLRMNRCLGLLVGLADGSGMFTTKVSLSLIDCNSKQVFVTKEGRSKEKDFNASYSEAIRDAFTSFDAVTYHYKPKSNEGQPVTLGFKNDVKQMGDSSEKASAPTPVVQQEATLEQQSYKNREPVASTIKKAEIAQPQMVGATTSSGVLYAQEIPNGYQLVDRTPKIVLKIYRSNIPNLFHAVKDGKNGIVYKKGEQWFFEYYEGDQLMAEELNINF